MVVDGTAAKLFTKVVRSGKWQSVSAVTKDRLANYIASGDAAAAGQLIHKIGFATGVQLTKDEMRQPADGEDDGSRPADAGASFLKSGLAKTSEFKPENDMITRVSPDALFPSQFKSARSALASTPIDDTIRGSDYEPVPSGGGKVLGLYGEPVPTVRNGIHDVRGNIPGPGGRGGANTVQTTREADPHEIAHEYAHAIRERDLTPQQVKRFESFYSSRVARWRELQQKAIDPDTTDAQAQKIEDELPSVEQKLPRAVLRNEQHAQDNPQETDVAPSREAFADLAADYITAPRQFKARYPDWYGLMRDVFGGREYVGGKISDARVLRR
jgi:hypothetical protein